MNTTIVAHCRSGFERECLADLSRLAKRADMVLDSPPVPTSAYVAVAAHGFDPRRWQGAQADEPAVFARSIFVGSGLHPLPERDRITPLLGLARTLGPPFGAIWLETPDSNEGKKASSFCRKLAPLLELRAAAERSLSGGDASAPRLHFMFESKSAVLAGTSRSGTGSAWPMGIPRLKMTRAAPSRSSLKLAEAFLVLLSEEERARWLRPGMRAVDLGAAPGGWTWQLAERGLRVTAVDNASLKGDIASDPLVAHLRVDGLKYRPRRAVDWMVCDIVDKPSRIAALVADWIAEGRCRRAIFNLKLPMKKRYEETMHCKQIIDDQLRQLPGRYKLLLRQLYHDREEVTGLVARIE